MAIFNLQFTVFDFEPEGIYRIWRTPSSGDEEVYIVVYNAV
jgi:hypothetical protein